MGYNKSMKVTKLEKKKRLYLLEIDHKKTLHITEDTLIHFLLSNGKEISNEELAAITDFSRYSHAKNLALYHLSFKNRTTQEVARYLEKHDISKDTLTQVINDLTKDRWLDDSAYAKAMIDANLATGDKGPMVLSQKFRQKGIPETLYNPLLEEHDFSPLCLKTAQKIAKTKQNKLPLHALTLKIQQHLAQKGFESGMITQVLSELDLKKNEAAEIDLLQHDLDKYHKKYSKKYEGYALDNRILQALMRRGYDYSAIKRAMRDL